VNEFVNLDENQVRVSACAPLKWWDVEFKLSCAVWELLVEGHCQLSRGRNRKQHENAQVHQVRLGGVFLGLVKHEQDSY